MMNNLLQGGEVKFSELKKWINGLRSSCARVYVSCVAHDRDTVNEIAAELIAGGVSIVCCDEDCTRSETLRGQVKQEIDLCEAVVCFISGEYFLAGNAEASDELDYAVNHNKDVLLVMLSDGSDIPEPYTQLAWVEIATFVYILNLVTGKERKLSVGISGDAAPSVSLEDFGAGSPSERKNTATILRLTQPQEEVSDVCDAVVTLAQPECDAQEPELDPMEQMRLEMKAGMAARKSKLLQSECLEECSEQDMGEMTQSPLFESFDVSQTSQIPTKGAKVKPSRSDKVDFSLISPETVKRGEYASIDLFMYMRSKRKVVDDAIREMLKKAGSAMETSQSGFSVTRGSLVTAVLKSDDVEITDDSETRRWEGGSSQFGFQFFVPEAYKKRQAAFTCYIYLCGVRITRLSFAVRIASRANVPVKIKRLDYKKAFVSYCHADKPRVLTELSVIQHAAPKMHFWLDTQSLNPGDRWSKAIYKAIRTSDVMLLFWSKSAKESSEVAKEWTYAIKRKGVDFIAPVPLDPPSQCPPPPELSMLHFGHSSFDDYGLTEDISFINSRCVHKVR